MTAKYAEGWISWPQSLKNLQRPDDWALGTREGTWFSTLTNGVLVLGLCGLAFMGGWLEQMSDFTESSWLVMLGIISSLIMPSEAIWRRAAFEMQSPVAGALPFSPFANISVPSNAMIGYAAIYLVVVLPGKRTKNLLSHTAVDFY